MKLIASHDAFNGESVRIGPKDELLRLAGFLVEHTLLCDMLIPEEDPPIHEEVDSVLNILEQTGTYEGYGIRLKLED